MGGGVHAYVQLGAVHLRSCSSEDSIADLSAIQAAAPKSADPTAEGSVLALRSVAILPHRDMILLPRCPADSQHTLGVSAVSMYRAAQSSPTAGAAGSGHLILHPQPPAVLLSLEAGLHFLLSGQASLSQPPSSSRSGGGSPPSLSPPALPCSSFTLHSRATKRNLAAVPHPLAWSAASASAATVAHSHYSASDILLISGSSSLAGFGPTGSAAAWRGEHDLMSRHGARDKGIRAKFAQPVRLLSVPPHTAHSRFDRPGAAPLLFCFLTCGPLLLLLARRLCVLCVPSPNPDARTLEEQTLSMSHAATRTSDALYMR